MIEKYCQSCGMPMADQSLQGTNADGSTNEDYCSYCFSDGQFSGDMTMQEMIDFCVPHMANAETGMSEEVARKMMTDFFPQLKRWKNTTV